MAGISVAMVLVPQALAYATIAGVPPAYGLLAAVAAPIAGALVGSSPYLQTGPVAVTSLLTFGALSAVAEPSTARFAMLAGVLAIVVGLVRIGLGLAGAGPIAYLMSQPVVVSFTSASAVLIIGTQVPALLGVEVDAGNPLLGALQAASDPTRWSVVDLVLGATALLVMLGGRRIWALFPGALLAVLGGIVWSRWTGYEGAVVGDVAIELRGLSGVAVSDVAALLIPGAVIAVVGFAEPASIARRYAAMDRRPWDSNREFIGQGLANLASGVVGAFPVGGSFSRTSLNRLSGARTRWSGFLTGVTVAALLPLAFVLKPLPLSVLAGLVIGAVAMLIDVKAPGQYWRWSRPQFAVGVITGVATLALAPRVDLAVLIGVGAALAVHLWREMGVAVPASVEGDVLHLRPTGVLYFGSTPAVERTLNALIADHPDVARVVVHLDRVGRLDVTGALMLRDILEESRIAGRDLEIRGARAHAAKLLTRVIDIPVAVDPEVSP